MMLRFHNISFLLLAFFLANICYAQQNSPIEIVNLFNECYGGHCMDEIANYTTPHFRDNKPKSVWVVETWKSLKEIKFQKLNSSIVYSDVKSDKAAVVMEVRIKTVAGETSQKEIYYLIKEEDKWLLNELVITDEEIDTDETKL